MEEVEVLIVGQGLSGTWLSWWLHTAGVPFAVIDGADLNSASRRAAGLINPVTGRRLVTTWMVEELMPFANDAYSEIGNFLNDSFIEETSIIDFFPSVQMLQSFHKRLEEDQAYLKKEDDRDKYATWFNYELGWGAIQPCSLIKVEALLNQWRKWLIANERIKESDFDTSKLVEHAGSIQYQDIRARYIVFCDGRSSAENPWFANLPFALNKGEGMLVEIKNLSQNQVFKKGMSLIPYKEDIWWLGSSYEWTFDDDLPSDKFRQQAESWLRHFLKLPYTIMEHFAAVRPATLERRPFVGFHPLHPSIGILNGMGTKGCSLAPYFAKQLTNTMTGQQEIHPLADINRFKKILSL